ncbi:ATP-dependent RNA helicase DHX30-like [Diadema setosum]|uniref:ATP-dependent RNA helicase DHX30-like n=1 Tax=Diadema setosum TaxID=31175 RepID=UPI003B3B624B
MPQRRAAARRKNHTKSKMERLLVLVLVLPQLIRRAGHSTSPQADDTDGEDATLVEKDFAAFTNAHLTEDGKLLKDFPNPKGILNKLISQGTSDSPAKFLRYLTNNDPFMKRSTLKLSWPAELEFKGYGRKKKEAEIMATARACHTLKEQGLLDENNNPHLPEKVLYDKESIRKFLRDQTQPDLLEFDETVKDDLCKLVQHVKDNEAVAGETVLSENPTPFYSSMMPEEPYPPIRDVITDEQYQPLSTAKSDRKSGALLQKLVNRGSKVPKELQTVIKSLPIAEMRDEIVSIIDENQVTVLCGETGCGKTTQVPQFILDDWIQRAVGSRCNVVTTQPRRVSVISTAKRIALERGERMRETTGYQIRLDRMTPENHGCMLFCTTGILLQKLRQNPDLRGVSHVIIDEAHERDINIDFLLILLRDVLKRNERIKLVLMSASINPTLFSKYFDNAPVINVPGFMHPVKEFFLPETLAELGINPSTHKSPIFQAERANQEKTRITRGKKLTGKAPPTNVDLVVDVIKAIDQKKPPGAILCFLPSWQDIRSVNDKLKADWGKSDKYVIYPVHSNITMDNQQAMFDIPPEGVRKVVLATNIAETSITIGDVVYVVDPGNHKEERFSAEYGVSCLDLHWASRANIRQRKGRAGRRQPGECFHLFDRDVFNRMSEYQVPEMLRIPLEHIVVQAKVHNDSLSAAEFLSHALETPPPEAVSAAVDLLQDLDIMDNDEHLTPLGQKVACFACDPRIAKALIFSAIFRCVDPILTIAASLSTRDLFRENLENRKEIMELMQKFAQGNESDHLVRLEAYQGWFRRQVEEGRESADEYVQSNQLYLPTLQFIRGLRRQFASNLEDADMVMSMEDCFNPEAGCNEYSRDAEIVKAVICSAFYPNLLRASYGKHESGKLKPDKLVFKDLDHSGVLLYRKSVNCGSQTLSSRWLTYFSKMRIDVTFVRDCSVVHPLAVIAFVGNVRYMEKLSNKDKKVLHSRGDSVNFHDNSLVKLVIDDNHPASAAREGGREYSPWEGLPISFYVKAEMADCAIEYLNAIHSMIEECLREDALFMTENTRDKHSSLLAMFSRLLHTSLPTFQLTGKNGKVQG